jgi:multiple sugar transport system ATP-binding protein
MASVDFDHIDKTFPDGTRAIVDCGPSGCGKSTLLRLLAGLEQVTSGTLRIGGRVVNDLPPQTRNVAMVFQDYALYPFMTVRGNLEFPLKMRKLPRDERRRRVEWAAGLLDISQLLDRRPRQLSGGQRQRVAMGRALVREPTVFLLDEPLSNLDAKLRVQVRAEIGELQRRTGTTMIYVTHDQVEAMTLGQRVAVLHQGRLQQVASPREIYDHPVNAFVAGFIGNPPMNLFRTRVVVDERRRTCIAVGDQAVPISSRSKPGTALTAGIRPEAFRLASPSVGDGTIRVTVEHVEYLGHETLAHVRVGDQATADAIRLIVRIAGMHEFGKEQGIDVQVDPNSIHSFDEAGQAVTNRQ